MSLTTRKHQVEKSLNRQHWPERVFRTEKPSPPQAGNRCPRKLPRSLGPEPLGHSAAKVPTFPPASEFGPWTHGRMERAYSIALSSDLHRCTPTHVLRNIHYTCV